MPQIELTDVELEKVDELVKEGLFSNRNEAIQTGLKSLFELVKDEIKKMEKARAEVNAYLTGYVGDILFSGFPIKIVIDNKEYFKVPVKGRYENKVYIYGHILVNCHTLEIDTAVSDSPKKIHETAIELTGGTEDDSPLL